MNQHISSPTHVPLSHEVSVGVAVPAILAHPQEALPQIEVDRLVGPLDADSVGLGGNSKDILESVGWH